MGRARGHLADGLIALALLAVGLTGTAPAGRNQGIDHIPPWAYACVVAAALAVAFCRSYPTAALAAVTAAVGLYLLGGNPFGPIMLSLLVAVYTVAALRPLRRAALTAGAVLAVLVVCALIGLGVGPDAVMPQVAWVAGPLAIGVTVRVGREQVLQGRRDEARRQADAERLRVAQEVHDVVGHGLAAITMQADIALHLLAKNPSAATQAQEALAAISRTSRESLDELRATLGAVRRGSTVDDRSPAPGLARLDDLVARTRAVGVPVRVELDGPLTGLPAAVDLAAYRIVQEALTNVRRHAAAGSAQVAIEYAPAELRLAVRNDGPATGAPPEASPGAPGSGIAGMRARAESLGGTLTAGPLPEGGYLVSAVLPTAAAPVEENA